MEENYLKEGQISSQVFLHRSPSQVGSIFKLDVILTIEEGRSIIESSVGIGEDDNEAAIDAFEQFTLNSFHVLLSSFFTPDFNNKVNVEEWNIGKQKFDAIFSNVSMRGQAPQPLPMEWFKNFAETVKRQNITKDIHWVRLFYAISNNELINCEVLLDNEDWIEVQDKAATFALPNAEKYLSLRMFFVLKPKD